MICCPMCTGDLSHLEAEWWRCHACGYLHRNVEVKRPEPAPPEEVKCCDCKAVFSRAEVPRSMRCPRCQRSHRYVLVLAWQAEKRHGVCGVCGGRTAWPKYKRCRKCWAESVSLTR